MTKKVVIHTYPTGDSVLWATAMWLRLCLSDDLLSPEWLALKKKIGAQNIVFGHCYILNEALFHLFPNRFAAMSIGMGVGTHWYLIDKDTGHVVDFTADQFVNSMVPYTKGVRRGFLTKQPSKRCVKLLARLPAFVHERASASAIG